MRKQISVMTILTLIFFLLASPVLAEPVKPDSAGSNSSVGPQAMTMLREGSTTMGAAGTGLLAISLSTYAYHTVNEVGVDATLQQWDGSDWVDVRTYPFVKYNKNDLADIGQISDDRLIELGLSLDKPYTIAEIFEILPDTYINWFFFAI